jgi:cytochrome c peroxidase
MDNPLFKKHPAEMGLAINDESVLQVIMQDATYKKLFINAGETVNWQNIKKSINAFIHSIESYNAAYDKFLAGDTNAITTSAKKGAQLFYSNQLNCGKCHGGNNFSTPNFATGIDTLYYYNTGLYNFANNNRYPAIDVGLQVISKNDKDNGRFRVPTLRNLLFTAPYYHDGSEASLLQVVNNYATGGRNISEGEYKGNGNKNSLKHPLITGFDISESQKIDLVNFLQSLSDSSLLYNKLWANPFTYDETKNLY